MQEIVVSGEECSRDDLDERAGQLAGQLAGARSVAVVATATVDTVAAVLGARRAGAAAIPISADAGSAERAHVLRDSGADAIVDGGAVRPIDKADDVAPMSPPGTALVLYTSGTTGPPKGVPVTQQAIDACIDGLADAWDWTADDVLVHGLPLHHVHGLVLGVLGPLRVGSALHHTGRPTPGAYAAAGGSLYFGVPTIWSRVADDPNAARALTSARLLVSGSAPLRAATFDALAALTGLRPVERYGMTETLITASTRADGPRVPGVVGLPLPGVRTRLVDDDGELIDHDGLTFGELQVAGPNVFSGYLGRPDATASSFTPDGWFRTGDVATIGPDDTHRIVGRASTDLIKSGGYRVGAGEVEDCLLSHPSVAEAAVTGEPDDDLGQRIVAFVVASGCTEADLVNHVATMLTPYKRPRQIVFVDALPRNAMGKVEKSRLSQP